MRIWRGWTTREHAQTYEALLNKDIVPHVLERAIPGFIDISVARRARGEVVEFVTIMWFESVDAVKAFAGEDYHVSVVPYEARALLIRFDLEAAHYDTVRPPKSTDVTPQ